MRHHMFLWLTTFRIISAQALDVDGLAVRQATNVLGQLESMGVQVLSNILSPSAAASTTDSASATTSSPDSASATTTTSSSATTPTSASTTSSISSTTSSPSVSSSLSSASATAAAASSPSSSALAIANSENTRHRNIAIIVGSVLGAVVLLLLLALLWFCCRKRRERKSKVVAAKEIDDDEELDPVMDGGPGGMAYVTRIESWHEPRNKRSISAGPPKGSQSRVSLVQRDVPERYNEGPSAPVPMPIPPPHRSSQYGLIQNDGPYDEAHAGYFDRPHRHSMDDVTRDPNRYPGYVPYRSQSSQALVERTPTPLFGSGKTPGEQGQAIKRKSVGSGPTTAVNTGPSSKNPSPHSNSGGPWVPPKSVNRRRESLPGSPLANEFDFGFAEQNRRTSRERMPGGWSSSSIGEAHHRF